MARQLIDLYQWGMGKLHAELWQEPDPCERCGGSRRVGHPLLPAPCPECSPVTEGAQDEDE